MVVWLFAGGGEAEVKGLVQFLRKNFTHYDFEIKTPIRNKPGPKADQAYKAYGKTGKSLAAQIKEVFEISLKYHRCDAILIIDDLDCRDYKQQHQFFLNTLETYNIENIDKIIGFAAPELEAWIVADWNNTFAKYSDFRGFHQKMQYWLSTDGKVSFEKPESFSEYDPQKGVCKEKLSEMIIQAVWETSRKRFSKAIHTPDLLQMANPENVALKCPLFRELYRNLKMKHIIC